MNKKVLLVYFMLFISLFAGAQIRRNIDGIELGKSTKKDVIRYAREKGFSCKFFDGGNRVCLQEDYNSVYFAGKNWTYVNYILYNDVVYQISYVMANAGDLVRDYHKYDDDFKELQRNIIQKYSQSKKQELKHDIYKIKDKKTQIEIELSHKKRNALILRYYDISLSVKAKQKTINDL